MQVATAGVPRALSCGSALAFSERYLWCSRQNSLTRFLFHLKILQFSLQQLLNFRYLKPPPIHAVGCSISSVTSFPCYPRDGCPGFSKQGYNHVQLVSVFLCLRHALPQVKKYPWTLNQLRPDISSQHQQNTKSLRWQKGTVIPVWRGVCRHRSKGRKFLQCCTITSFQPRCATFPFGKELLANVSLLRKGGQPAGTFLLFPFFAVFLLLLSNQ